ncbi:MULTISPECIES: EamA family transporter [Paraburkholderia]|uniref:EamA family transporter n=1 Tax=Paraburkholderia TaxID=1822464 RepID=UPI002256716C|nr:MULTISPECIES: EamA family transporter [Paraburkholderia]MCX4161316.1 EamA family transporter [Paraburkholderia megapolitana]MDN7156812.1 EamA family transporter [Paraburkholderia sp. CHISQ3]MDQ6493857.1 EamA family transporter [Paraburkholderia megapolitana]
MSPVVIALALGAAVLHASWNAALRTGADRLWSVTVMSFAATAVAIPVAAILPLPAAASWPYLVLSSCLQIAYSLFLVQAYRRGELGQVYPIVRGSVPLLVTLGAFLLTGRHPATLSLAGVALVAGGILSLSLGNQRAHTESIVMALVTGLMIAGYTTTDALGVRHTGNAQAYVAWIFLLYGVLMPITFVALRGKPTLNLRAPDTLKALAGGVASLVAYGAVVSAFALGPVGPIAALRETSIVFAALIGRVFLGETLTVRRITACVIVTLGALCLGYQA